MEKVESVFELKEVLDGNDLGRKKPRILHKDGIPMVCPFKPAVLIPTVKGDVVAMERFCGETCPKFELWKDKKDGKDVFFAVTVCNGVDNGKIARVSYLLKDFKTK